MLYTIYDVGATTGGGWDASGLQKCSLWTFLAVWLKKCIYDYDGAYIINTNIIVKIKTKDTCQSDFVERLKTHPTIT